MNGFIRVISVPCKKDIMQKSIPHQILETVCRHAGLQSIILEGNK